MPVRRLFEATAAASNQPACMKIGCVGLALRVASEFMSPPNTIGRLPARRWMAAISFDVSWARVLATSAESPTGKWAATA